MISIKMCEENVFRITPPATALDKDGTNSLCT